MKESQNVEALSINLKEDVDSAHTKKDDGIE
jgi:hypothetical protein